MEKEVKILNSTFEVALRLLAIMITCKKSKSVERLAIYSYFALYLSDLDNKEKSLHPEIPYRNEGYINSRDAIMEAIDMLLSKGLTECDFSNRSVKFSVTELGAALYAQIGGTYKEQLVECIKRAHKQLGRKSDTALNSLIYGNMADWGSEFTYESVLNGIGYEE